MITEQEENEVNPPPAIVRQDSWRTSAAVLSVFAILFSLITITGFLQKSPTADEPIHLFAGYSYLKWADFRANPEHPPLAKLWAALPLLAFDLKDSRHSSTNWDLIAKYSPTAIYTVAAAGKMLFVDNNAETLFFYAKLQMIALGILLGVFVYRWSKELFGFDAAVASLFIYCLDPNILAHSQIVHTDIAFTAIFFIATYFFWRALGQLNWTNLIAASLFFGLAAITKYAYLALLLAWGLLGLLNIFSSQPQQCTLGLSRAVSSRWGKTALLTTILICCVITAYVSIWSAYGFRFAALSEAGHLPMSQQLPENPYLQGLVAFIAQHQLFPEAWIYGQLFVLNNLQRSAYLMGSFSDHGFWLYFPVAFAVKTPIPTLILLIGTVGMWVFKRREKINGLFLLVPVVVYFSLAVLAGINIGLRHILPIYPFLFVLAGGTAAELWKGRNWLARGGLIFLSLWYLWSSISIYPHYLAFFNEIAGGPKNGHKILLDSNLDWGQDLKGLKRWMEENRVKKIQFLYFGFYDVAEPQYYGIDALYLPGSWVGHDSLSNNSSEIPDYLAISANHLFFGHFFLQGERREDFVKPFGSLSPAAIIGHSIYIYRMSDAIEQLREAIQMRPTSAETHADLGSLLENQGRIDGAMEEYRRAIRLNPNSTKAHYNLGIVLTKQGELEEAVEHLYKAAETSPLDAEAHYDLALVLAMKGNLEEAIQQFRRTLDIDPTYTKAHYNLAVVLESKGDVEEAIQQFLWTLNVDPAYTRAYYHLGTMLARRGNIEEAIGLFQQALQLEPDFAEAHESLGHALALQGRKEEAVQHYQEALRILKARSEGPAAK